MSINCLHKEPYIRSTEKSSKPFPTTCIRSLHSKTPQQHATRKSIHHSKVSSPLRHHHHRVSLSSPLSHSLSFPSGFRSKKHPVVRCSISKLANMFGDFVVSLLPRPSKEEVIEVIEGLKKFGNYKRALLVLGKNGTLPAFPKSNTNGSALAVNIVIQVTNYEPSIHRCAIQKTQFSIKEDQTALNLWHIFNFMLHNHPISGEKDLGTNQLLQNWIAQSPVEVFSVPYVQWNTQICELMNTKPEVSGMTMTAADAALQLDLIDTVHGTLAAEDYFLKLPETLKDQQTHTVLLMAYVNSEMREKAESIHTQMIIRGYPMMPIQFMVMMILYMNLKEYDKVDLLVSEMRQKNIPLDVDCYNVWLLCLVDQGSVEKVEQVNRWSRTVPLILTGLHFA
ncbi:hypothetical protein RHMOL_Rhmol07G0045400 [Rhododendron molle]|uniref:Uncharacterized protein n=1 Tax=Rhododendron molle TaxID=49168 RepID=A0ACC0MZ02_RHOML|nr:hypothetical protein RHMOL_Rhmol07G0045400 [Rhododendron molle]